MNNLTTASDYVDLYCIGSIPRRRCLEKYETPTHLAFPWGGA